VTGKRRRKIFRTYFVTLATVSQLARSQLYREKHLLGEVFLAAAAAAADEFMNCQERDCFKTTLAAEADSQTLPSM
jgi:hypothetical protein